MAPGRPAPHLLLFACGSHPAVAFDKGKVAVNMRIALWASAVFTAMTLSALYIGPGVGVEANCVTLQTCGKTLMVALKDILLSAHLIVNSRLPMARVSGGDALFTAPL